MKWIRPLLVTVVLVMCVYGCNSRQNAFVYSQIQSVTVFFEMNEDTFRVVEIDFEQALKHTSDYSDNTKSGSSEAFDNGPLLDAYLRETMIPAISGQNAESPDEDSLLVWKVEIQTDGGKLTQIGTERDPFPTYWEKLLSLIG